MSETKLIDVTIIGMGYVGLSLARVLSGSGLRVRGIDADAAKVEAINQGRSPLVDLPAPVLQEMLGKGFLADTHFGAVVESRTVVLALPTPVGKNNLPDLGPLERALQSAGPFRRDGQLWILESTVLPGVTEHTVFSRLVSTASEATEPPLVAYSPERVDPGSGGGDLLSIPKIVAGRNSESLEKASAFYAQAGFKVVAAGSIKEAEAAKLLENTYRAVNMALVNELAQRFMYAGIDILEVVRLAETKPFGFQAFWPGPGVGGHCIPVDPWYLQSFLDQESEQSMMTATALEINQEMPRTTAARIKEILSAEAPRPLAEGPSVIALGMSYKRDVNDFRESPGPAVVRALLALGLSVAYHDPYLKGPLPGLEGARWVDDLVAFEKSLDAVVVLQEHSEYRAGNILEAGSAVWLSAAPGLPGVGQSIWMPRS